MSHNVLSKGVFAIGLLFASSLMTLPPLVAQGSGTTPQQVNPSPPPPPPQPARQAPARRVGQPVNIRIELVLTDSAGEKVIAQERLITSLADRQLGRVRRRNGPPSGPYLPGTPPITNRMFEVDVTPEIVGQKIMLAMTLNYMAPAGPVGEDEKTVITVIENASAFLENGKSTPIIEAQGDPVGNRRVTVIGTATIQR